jgi:hypothetical protein
MTDELTPFEDRTWWKSRKFWSAVVLTGAAWAAAVATGGVTVPVALTASSPLLAWMGIEGVADAVSAGRR